MERTEIVKMIGEAIRRRDPEAMTLLYGSQARGEARADSDIDILILVDGESLSPKRMESYTSPLNDIEWSTGVIISPIVMLKTDWERRRYKTPFYLNINNEGVRI